MESGAEGCDSGLNSFLNCMPCLSNTSQLTVLPLKAMGSTG
jgi:hypothetical protein